MSSERHALNDDDFTQPFQTAQAEIDHQQPQVVVGNSRRGPVAMNINIGDTKLVLLCPAWKHWGTASTVKPGTVILYSRADDVIPYADSEELAKFSRATLIEVGTDLSNRKNKQRLYRLAEGHETP